jgi:hypothetical protein
MVYTSMYTDALVSSSVYCTLRVVVVVVEEKEKDELELELELE